MSCINHFITSNPDLYSMCGVIPCGATDHHMIFGTCKKHKVKHSKVPTVGRAYSHLKPEAFVLDVCSQDWSSVFEEQDGNGSWLNFREKFILILNAHAPYKTFQARADRQPWVTTEYLENCNERDELINVASLSQNQGDIALAKRARNRVVFLKRDLKHIFFRTSINDAQGNMVAYGRC